MTDSWGTLVSSFAIFDVFAPSRARENKKLLMKCEVKFHQVFWSPSSVVGLGYIGINELHVILRTASITQDLA